jgi:hypothetical protein
MRISTEPSQGTLHTVRGRTPYSIQSHTILRIRTANDGEIFDIEQRGWCEVGR